MPRRPRSPRRPGPADPFAALGLPTDASARDIVEARRRLAKLAHPDAGGSVERMQQVNEAADAALRASRRRPVAPPASPEPPRRAPDEPPLRRRRDHPSFTIEALPVEAFEALLVVGSWLGDLIDDEPPYALELALTEPVGAWCRLDLVPDAGASTVSVTVGSAPGHPMPTIDDVRDAFVAGLNRLDWSDLT